jgi:tetratricopeptide (TPR) repeat protein
MELGLLNEASEKFQRVLDSAEIDSHIDASYGLASCMLASARQAQEEGKFGIALSHLKRGIATLNILIDSHLDRNFYCIWKMLGDLYSLGFLIPISAFANVDSDGCRQKLDFIAQGHAAYSHVVSHISKLDPSNSPKEVISTVLGTAFNDLGINCLLRARICAELKYEGSGLGKSTCWVDVVKDEDVHELLDSAISYFTDAVIYNPLSPRCWAGIGYALIARNPVIAQHAFCRALQVDKSNVDAWANLCLLYLHHDDIHASEQCVDSLTQVSDSAIMWLARGFHAEKSIVLEPCKRTHVLAKAFDAYQASLQISRQQGALLGLSLIARKIAQLKNQACNNDSEFALFLRESSANLEIYLNFSGSYNIGAIALSGITSIEEAINLKLEGHISSELVHILIQKGANLLQNTQEIVDSFCQENFAGKEETRNKIYAVNGMRRNVYDSASVEDITNEVIAYTDAAKRFSNNKCDLSSDSYIEERTSIRFARQNLLSNPSDSLLWLELGKALLQGLTSTSTMESYEAAFAAVKRSKETMILQVSNSSRFDSVHSINQTSTSSPSSSRLSEVFALSYSMHDICLVTRKRNTYDLQKSLLLDPENYIARSMIS